MRRILALVSDSTQTWWIPWALGIAVGCFSSFTFGRTSTEISIVAVEIAIVLQLRHIKPQANSWFFKKRFKMAFATFSRRTYFSKPRMYGMTGGRGPVLKSGPRVER